MKFAVLPFAALFAVAAPALEVVYDSRTPENLREWGERSFVREQMEVLGAKICKALYGGTRNENLHEGFRIALYLAPTKGGNPAFASGRRITWKVGPNPGGDGSGGTGLLCHEMTHVFDFNAGPMSKQRFRKIYDGVFVEATADWVRNYKVWYNHCTDPSHILDLRYKALRGGRNYGKYLAGANFLDFIEQNYGEGTANRLIWDITANGKHSWKRLLGKDIDALVKEWRQMETIYDPVFQWNYNGTAAGAVRKDKKFCGLKTISAVDSPNKAGAWLDGATASKVEGVTDGSLTIALHGRFPKKDNVAIASLGAAKEGNGKALLLTTSSKPGALAAHVIATVPGKGCHIVSTTPIPFPVPRSPFPIPHSLILSVKGGDEASVIVDGKPVAKIDMKTKCNGCSFSPVFGVGGMSGGFGVAGFSEPRGAAGVLLDDVRVFTRAFRPRETSDYAKMFGPDYRGAVAVEATWCGPQGGREIDNPGNWVCFNAYGEKIVAIPSKETEVTVWFRAIPSIPLKSKFECKSFTIDGIAVADEANVDLRGVRSLEASDNTRIITRNGHVVAVNALQGARLRLDGSLAVVSGLKLDGNLEMNGGSVLRLPERPETAVAKSISVAGEGDVFLMPGEPSRRGRTSNLMRLEKMPSDFSHFRLKSGGDGAATFKAATGGKFLCATPK